VPLPVSASAFLTDLLFRHWAQKIGAIVLAAIVFVFTRDEVTRGYEIPLRVIPDRERVLLTDVPDTVKVMVRGPWTRVNRLQEYDFGTATLDLRSAQPGPLEIDRASIVMPAGVVLAGMQYDHVDLRFEPVVERAMTIDPNIIGKPGSDHRVVRVETEPTTWTVRGGRSQVEGVAQLSTEPLDLGGADETVEADLAVLRPSGVRLAERAEGPPSVHVRVVIEPVADDREVTVRVPRNDPLAIGGVLPSSYRVRLSGPAPTLRQLDELGLDDPLAAVVSETDDPQVVQVRFEWNERVPAPIREKIRLDRSVVRVPLPAAATARAGD
jgi:YbbR domain-containing protein